MKRYLSTLLSVAVMIGAAGTSTFSSAADEVNVVMFGMPYTKGLAALADDFEAQTGIKANIDVIGQDVFENRITLSFTGKSGDIDVVHSLSFKCNVGFLLIG
ncbi:MAG: hypothetical protein AB8B97_27365 [Granulosicoccus sp.]